MRSPSSSRYQSVIRSWKLEGNEREKAEGKVVGVTRCSPLSEAADLVKFWMLERKRKESKHQVLLGCSLGSSYFLLTLALYADNSLIALPKLRLANDVQEVFEGNTAYLSNRKIGPLSFCVNRVAI